MASLAFRREKSLGACHLLIMAPRIHSVEILGEMGSCSWGFIPHGTECNFPLITAKTVFKMKFPEI